MSSISRICVKGVKHFLEGGVKNLEGWVIFWVIIFFGGGIQQVILVVLGVGPLGPACSFHFVLPSSAPVQVGQVSLSSTRGP